MERQEYPPAFESAGRVKQTACNIFYRQPRIFYVAEGALMNGVLIASGVENAGPYIGATSLVAAGSLSVLYKKWWREIEVGQHMVLKPERFVHFKKVRLSDSTDVSPGELVGRIHFSSNFNELHEDTSIVTYTRELVKSGQESLGLLAEMCQEDKRAVKDINVFWGRSHLVGKFTERFGFDTMPVNNPLNRSFTKFWAKDCAREVVGNHPEWKRFEKNFRDPRDAYISREKLIAVFGKKE